MKKEALKIILGCLIVFIIMFTYNSFINHTYDHIWDFMHSYSICKGLLIYKDFNIVVGPIYPVLMALFLKLFGNNLLVFDIINSLFIVCVYLVIRINNKKTLALFAIVCLISGLVGKYNSFTLLLFYIIYFAEKNNYKNKDIIIGILLALLFFTKINIGASLTLATIIINYKNIKSILRRAISFIVTSLTIIMAMILFGVFPDFINYTILGLFDFSKNLSISLYIILVLISVFYILINVKKDRNLFYMLFYLIMSYPLFDSYHVFIAIFPTLVYFLDSLKQSKYTRMLVIIFSILISVTIYISITNSFNSSSINFKEKCINGNCFLSKHFYSIFDIIHGVNNNIKNKDDYQLFFISTDAYLYKYDLHKNINKYDLLLTGNMGYNGENKYIKEIKNMCSEKKCLFLIDDNRSKENPQFPKRLRDFVLKQYHEKYQIKYKEAIVSIYTND